MTPEQQRTAIAERCGWRLEYDTTQLKSVWVSPKSGYGYDLDDGFVPKYTEDRDAIIGVIWDKIVGDEELEAKFLEQLNAIWGNREEDDTICVHKIEMALICSSALDFCEALLRTLNLWKNTP